MNKLNQILTGKADALNVGLILLSLILAYLMPFSLFLVSYAVLGPLHYITEINWLNQKHYFVQHKSWIWIFIAFGLLISIPPMAHLPWVKLNTQPDWVRTMVFLITDWSDIFLLTILVLAIGLMFLKKGWHIALFFVFSLVLSKLITQYVLQSFIVIGIFLPTIIHVYVFTLLFMVLGALNSRSKASIIGLFIMLASPLLIWFVNVNPDFYLSLESSKSVETAQNFRFVNFIAEAFGAAENGRIDSYSVIGLKIQTFVAFCYTYHYLNWFGKVSTIGWRKNISSTKTTVLVSIWICAIALFLYDYEIAYLALFFMALLHIVLEFPLNALSVKMIWQKLQTRNNGSQV
jgi:hypothetical protein